jgi:hydroxymethylbilane synthase
MLTIGSRGSALALAQTHWIRDRILERYPGTAIRIQIIRTSADRDTKSSLRSSSAIGVFVKEIEDALLAREIDLAIHSMKDVPTRIPDALEIAAIPVREDVRDALITPGPIAAVTDLPQGAVVGTGSIRRQAQLLALRPDLQIKDIRGNVDTRLQKLADGSYQAVVLACAGLNRLGLTDKITLPIPVSQMLPAPGQGALALETRKNDTSIQELIAHINNPGTAAAVVAERAFLRGVGGGCNSPVAVHGYFQDEQLKLEGLVASPDGRRIVRKSDTASREQAEQCGIALAEAVLEAGGGEILRGH